MPEPPFVLMVAGPNGSGKTTLLKQLRREGIALGNHISPDEIAATLEGTYDERVRAAQVTASELRARCITDGVSFSFETVMSHASKIDVLQLARAQGFKTVSYFVATENVDLNIARVGQRVALGGHDVPELKIRERYVRSLGLLPLAARASDDITLFDNTMGMVPGGPAILRPFYRRVGNSVEVSPPIPKWALEAVRDIIQG